jgi:hypothetical protein
VKALRCCGATQQAAEKSMVSSEILQKHTSGAKAPLILHRLYRDKSPAYRPNELFQLYTADKSPAYRPNDFFSKLLGDRRLP